MTEMPPAPGLWRLVRCCGTGALALACAAGAGVAACEGGPWGLGLCGALALAGAALLRVRHRQSTASLQAATAAGEQRFRAIFEHRAVGMCETALDGRIIEVNQRFCELVGHPPDDLRGRHYREFTHPDDIAPDEALVARVLAGEMDSFTFEKRYLRRDGAAVWARLTASLVQCASGGPSHFVAVVEDIDERRRLKEHLQRLSSALEYSPVGVVVLDPDAVVQYANRAYSRMSGYAQEELIGTRPVPGPLGSGKSWLDQAYREVIGRRQWRGEVMVRRKDGSRYPAAVAVSPSLDADGRVVNLVATAEDITERRAIQAELDRHRDHLEDLVRSRTADLEAANARLSESERFARSVSETIPGLVAYWTSDQRCVYANEAYANLYGGDMSRVVGRRYDELLSPELRRLIDPYHFGALAGRPQRFEASRKDAQGQAVTLWVQAVPDFDDQGRVRGYLLLATDITAQKQAEQRLATLNAALQTERDRAEAASRTKSAFLANMSHEIRTPMNAIIGLTHLLKRDMRMPAAGHRVDKIGHAAHHLLDILNDILDLSKIESGKLELDCTDFLLDQLLDRALAMVAERARSRGLALSVERDPALPELLHGDTTRLLQGLVNLLGNAVKFTEAGSVRLRVVREQAGDGELCVRFEVHDTGMGIEPDQASRLFDAFEQADNSTTRRFGGTGLGLAITRSLAELMGGKVGAWGEKGRGSVFWFSARLPRARSGDAVAPAPREANLELLLRSSHAGARVLLAEDNPINQEVARDVLALAGLKVDLASNGQEAVERFQRQAYDLVLMDVQMPLMDGLEAARRIRALPGGAGVPILAMTANAFADNRATCLAAGMNDHLAKPVEATTLYGAMLRWLSPESAAPAPSEPAPEGTGLPPIEGVDVATGLSFFNGSRDIYRKLLLQFGQYYAGGVAQIRSRLEAGDLAALSAYVHSLKGAAGTVAAFGIERLAATLRAAIERDAPRAEIEGGVRSLTDALTALLAALQALQPAAGTASEVQ